LALQSFQRFTANAIYSRVSAKNDGSKAEGDTGEGAHAQFTANGRFVVFESGAQLVAGDPVSHLTSTSRICKRIRSSVSQTRPTDRLQESVSTRR
jgi:hypothetical protein